VRNVFSGACLNEPWDLGCPGLVLVPVHVRTFVVVFAKVSLASRLCGTCNIVIFDVVVVAVVVRKRVAQRKAGTGRHQQRAVQSGNEDNGDERNKSLTANDSSK